METDRIATFTTNQTTPRDNGPKANHHHHAARTTDATILKHGLFIEKTVEYCHIVSA
jgi:hypothetical protein